MIVGAGPSGLTLAAALSRFGVRVRIIDRALDRAHESRAFAVQARSLEVLQTQGLGEALVSRGNSSARILVHLGGSRTVEVRLADFGPTDTRFPFILFVSQAETEAVLREHLASRGVTIERGVELVAAAPGAADVTCVLRHQGGREERVQASYLAGCDGARSTVRKQAGIPFEGDAYLQSFMLGDVEVEPSLAPGLLHPFAIRRGIALFFPLGSPATWRVIAIAGTPSRADANAVPRPDSDTLQMDQLSLADLQSVVDGATGGGYRLSQPVWLTRFRLHHRQARHYRAGRIFLAGDAGHIHSPVGGQGMNTGIQDAWNLGWKLALVCGGRANEELLDSYEAERWPVGRALLRSTDRAFGLVARSVSGGGLSTWVRRTMVSMVLPRAMASRRLRAWIFKFVSELGIGYQDSPAVLEGEPPLRSGPRAGDRLPDASITRDGRPTYLQQELSAPRLHLLLCGRSEGWEGSRIAALTAQHAGLLEVHALTPSPTPGGLVDSDGEALVRLGLTKHGETAQYLVRPDGHIGFRCGGQDLRAVEEYLGRWFVTRSVASVHD